MRSDESYKKSNNRRIGELESNEHTHTTLENDLAVISDPVGLYTRLNGFVDVESSYFEDFSDDTAIPAGWAVAGSPFGSGVHSLSNSCSRFYGPTTGRDFLYKSWGASDLLIGRVYMHSSTAGAYVGLRADDGTDNNFVEARLVCNGAGSGGGAPYYYQHAYRTGGGSVTTSIGHDIYSSFTLRIALEGTLYSAWTGRGFIYPDNTWCHVWEPTTSSFSWTPARKGFVCSGGSAWNYFMLDWLYG